MMCPTFLCKKHICRPQGQEWVFEMVNNILIEVLGTIAEQERKTIKARQADGIEAAKKHGKKLGRPALTYPNNWKKVYADWKEKKSPQRWQWNLQKQKEQVSTNLFR